MKKKITPETSGEEIDEIFKRGKSILSPQLKETLEAAAQMTQSKRGGARKGAGRLPKDYQKTNLLLSPEARKKIEKMVQDKQATSLSDAANRLILK